MKVVINKSVLGGTVQAPPSKSLTIRALMCAALARGTSEIIHPLISDDTAAAAAVLGKIGANIQKEKDLWRVAGGDLHAANGELYCGESATTLRFMVAVCSLVPGRHTLTGGPSLSKRPVKPLVEALEKLGIKSTLGGGANTPVTIEGGRLKGGITELPGNISSQFVSALLLAAPFAENGLAIKLTAPLTSAPYVAMTLWCLEEFGINVRQEADRFIVSRQPYVPARIEIEGDWSSASYFLALGAFSSEGVRVANLSAVSVQGDSIILDYLRRMGAAVKVSGNAVTVSRGKLRAIRADLTDSIDLLPTVAALAALAEGTSELTGIERARLKESNRVAAVSEGLQELGVKVEEKQDSLLITGLKTPEQISGGTGKKAEVLIDSYNDHRIAMAFSIIGAARGGVVIDGAECVAKTYPEYWQAFQSAGGRMEVINGR